MPKTRLLLPTPAYFYQLPLSVSPALPPNFQHRHDHPPKSILTIHQLDSIALGVFTELVDFGHHDTVETTFDKSTDAEFVYHHGPGHTTTATILFPGQEAGPSKVVIRECLRVTYWKPPSSQDDAMYKQRCAPLAWVWRHGHRFVSRGLLPGRLGRQGCQ